MLVGGDGGMPRQEGHAGQRKGRGRMNEGGVGGWMVGLKKKNKKGLTHFSGTVFSLLHSSTFLSVQNYRSWSCGEGGVNYTLNPPPPVQTKLKDHWLKTISGVHQDANFTHQSKDGAEKNGL